MRFLSPDWVEAVGSSALAPRGDGFSGRVQVVVTGGPDGGVKYVVEWTDGRPAGASVGADPAAEVALTLPYKDAVAVARGDSDLNALFMQGQMKVAGPTGPLLAFLAAVKDPEVAAEAASLADRTDFA